MKPCYVHSLLHSFWRHAASVWAAVFSLSCLASVSGAFYGLQDRSPFSPTDLGLSVPTTPPWRWTRRPSLRWPTRILCALLWIGGRLTSAIMGHVVGASLPSLTWSVNLRLSASQPLNVALSRCWSFYFQPAIQHSNAPAGLLQWTGKTLPPLSIGFSEDCGHWKESVMLNYTCFLCSKISKAQKNLFTGPLCLKVFKAFWFSLLRNIILSSLFLMK